MKIQKPYQVATPLGTLSVTFPEIGPAHIEGPKEAFYFFSEALERRVNRNGVSLSLTNMDPIDLESSFNDGGASCVYVLEPLERSIELLKASVSHD